MSRANRESLCFTGTEWARQPARSERVKARKLAIHEAMVVLVLIPGGYRVEKDTVENLETPRNVDATEALRLLWAAGAEAT